MNLEETAEGVRVRIEAPEYRSLRRACETYREELVLRLAGEVGLGPAEMTRLTPAHVERVTQADTTHHLLRVPDDEGGARHAYLPPDVEHDLRQFARSAGVADDERYVSVSPRRVQMLVGEVTDRAADRTGNEQLREVSTRTLRHYFAHRLLVEEAVDPRVVLAVGGWERLESLAPYLEDASREAVLAAFAGTDLGPPESETAEGGSHATGGSPAGRLVAVVDAVDRVGQALADATRPGRVRTDACEALVEGDAYRTAWIADATADGLELQAYAGTDTPPVEEAATPGAAVEAALDGTLRATADVQAAEDFAEWHGHASANGYDSAVVVPVVDGPETVGVLGVGADTSESLGDPERRLLSDVGRRVGSELDAAEQRQLMRADTVVELSLECQDPGSFFVAASEAHDCSLVLEGVVPGDAESLLYFVTLTGTDPETFLGWATDSEAVTDARLVRDYGEEALVELVLTRGTLARNLLDHGGTVTGMSVAGGTQTIESHLPPSASVRAVVDDIAAQFPETELLRKRERDRPVEPMTSFTSALQEALTEKQAAVLQAAYHAGYFEWPRGSTAEELADAIGITSPTLHNHLRRAQQKLLTTFYDERQHAPADTPWSGSTGR